MEDRKTHASVNNMIDLKLNQNDLVDLILDEQSEKLEAEVKRFEELREKAHEDLKGIKEKLKKELSKLLTIDESHLRALRKLFPGHEYILELDLHLEEPRKDLDAKPDGFVYDLGTHRHSYDAKVSKTPINSLYKKAYIQYLTPNVLRISIMKVGYGTVACEQVNLEKKHYEKSPLMKPMKEASKSLFHANLELNKAEMTLFFFEKQSVRTKSKMVRQILKSTPEGADILKLASTVIFDTKKLLLTAK